MYVCVVRTLHVVQHWYSWSFVFKYHNQNWTSLFFQTIPFLHDFERENWVKICIKFLNPKPQTFYIKPLVYKCFFLCFEFVHKCLLTFRSHGIVSIYFHYFVKSRKKINSSYTILWNCQSINHLKMNIELV